MPDEPREITDLERAPSEDEAGTQAGQYGEDATGLGDEGAGPDRGIADEPDTAEDEHPRGEN